MYACVDGCMYVGYIYYLSIYYYFPKLAPIKSKSTFCDCK